MYNGIGGTRGAKLAIVLVNVQAGEGLALF